MARPATGLFALPREIRDPIWEHLLIEDVVAVTPLWHVGSVVGVNVSLPVICQVNRQIRTETLPVYFSNNFAVNVHWRTRAQADRWLAALGEESIRCLRHITLCSYGGMRVRPGVGAFDVLMTCEIDLERHQLKLTGYSQLDSTTFQVSMDAQRTKRAEDTLRLSVAGHLVMLEGKEELKWLMDRFEEFSDSEENPLLREHLEAEHKPWLR